MDMKYILAAFQACAQALTRQDYEAANAALLDAVSALQYDANQPRDERGRFGSGGGGSGGSAPVSFVRVMPGGLGDALKKLNDFQKGHSATPVMKTAPKQVPTPKKETPQPKAKPVDPPAAKKAAVPNKDAAKPKEDQKPPEKKTKPDKPDTPAPAKKTDTPLKETMPKKERRLKADDELDAAKDIQSLVNTFQRQHPKLDIAFTETSHVDTVRETMKAYNTMAQQYPEASAKMEHFGVGKKGKYYEVKDSMVLAAADERGVSITFNAHTISTEGRSLGGKPLYQSLMSYCKENAELTVPTWKGTVTHEFGHLYDANLHRTNRQNGKPTTGNGQHPLAVEEKARVIDRFKTKGMNEAKQEWRDKKMWSTIQAGKPDPTYSLSTRGLTNKKEFFGEVFAKLHVNGATTRHTKQLERILDTFKTLPDSAPAATVQHRIAALEKELSTIQ